MQQSAQGARWEPPARFLLFAFVVGFTALSAQHKSLTYDEPAHLEYGRAWLRGNPDRTLVAFDSKMPFSALNAFPSEVGRHLRALGLRPGWVDALSEPFAARMVTILLSLLLAIHVHRWSSELYGPVAGCFSLLLYSLSPNLIAHARLVTTDLFAACMTAIALYTFWRFLRYGGWSASLLSAVTLGISQLAKYICIYLYPIFAAIALLRSMGERGMRATFSVENARRAGPHVGLFLLVSLLVINVGFLFRRSFTPLGQYAFASEPFRAVQSLSLARHFPVPLPYPYLAGLDMVKDHETSGSTFGNLYLLGEIRRTDGPGYQPFSGYYFLALLYKVPISIQLLAVAALVTYVVRRKHFHFWRDESFLLLPVAFFLVVSEFLFRAQIGLRHLLVIFPLVLVFSGSLLSEGARLPRAGLALVGVLVLYLGVSVASYFPHYISYFNELVWDRTRAYEILADSNLNWGQNNWWVGRYLHAHPEAILNPAGPVAGTIVVDANLLVGVDGPDLFRWLRDRFEPVDHVAYSHLVFEVPGEAIESIR